MNPWDQFTGANAGYVYELFERYQRDPSSVDEATRRAFATWTPAFAREDSGELRRASQRTLAKTPASFGEASPRTLAGPLTLPICRRRLPRSTSRNPSGVSAIWLRISIRSASTIRSATRRWRRNRTD